MAKTALIADDDEYFRLALERMLRENLGFTEVIEAASFDGAIKRLEEADDVSLAIFDLSMPGIDSPAALCAVRESFRVERLAVVSASRDRGDVLRSLGAGAHGFVSKGDGVRELESALEMILEGRIYVPRMLAELDPAAPPNCMNAANTPLDSNPRQLTPRQRDVLALLVAGKSNREIAEALGLSLGTIKVHLAAIFRVLGVRNRVAAAMMGAHFLERPSAASARSSDAIDPEGLGRDVERIAA